MQSTLSPIPLLAAIVWPVRPSSRYLRAAALMVMGSAFIALCAQVAVPLWPVPITGQTLAVLVVGMAYGWRLGGATLSLYLCEGAAGLPVFANFSGGPAVLAGPTAGYLLGFVVGAALAGRLAERGWDRSVWHSAAAMALCSLLILACGVVWLFVFYLAPGATSNGADGLSEAWTAVLSSGVLPFLPGDAVKCVLGSWILPAARKLTRERA